MKRILMNSKKTDLVDDGTTNCVDNEKGDSTVAGGYVPEIKGNNHLKG